MAQSLRHGLLLPYYCSACTFTPTNPNVPHRVRIGSISMIHVCISHWMDVLVRLISRTFTPLLAACWWAAGNLHCCWTCAAPVPRSPDSWGSCGRAESGHARNLAQPPHASPSRRLTVATPAGGQATPPPVSRRGRKRSWATKLWLPSGCPWVRHPCAGSGAYECKKTVNAWGDQPDWCGGDIPARCLLCRRCWKSRALGAAEVGMIDWTASWGVFYIHQRGCKCPWLQGENTCINMYKWQFKGSLDTWILRQLKYLNLWRNELHHINYKTRLGKYWLQLLVKYHGGLQMCKSVTEHCIHKDDKRWTHPARTPALLHSSLQATCGVIFYISKIHLHTPEIEA